MITNYIPHFIYLVVLTAICIKLIYESKQPARTYSMLLLVIFLPVLGILFYLFFGQDRRKNKLYSKKLIKDAQTQTKLQEFINENQLHSRKGLPKKYKRFKSVSDLVFTDNRSLLTSNNKIELLINGESKFPKLKRDLLNAKDHIHLQYFIYEDDKMGQDIGKILIQKAQEGVKVRLLYDYFGSFGTIKNSSIKTLEKNGVEVATFHKPNITSSIDRLNFRNHRKIVVIDGKIGYTGGLNISNDYINSPEYPSKHYWRDSHLRIEGKSVWSLQQLFMSDWNFAEQDELKPSKEYFPEFKIDEVGPKWVQTVNSGPDSNYQSILFAYIEAIQSSEECIYLCTPYYIPTQEFQKAVIMAALKGVEVHLLVPEHSDSWYANAAAKSYYEDLLDAGVNIYFYTRGMFHAKTIMCDNQFSMVGTANLDYRSFDLNFEDNAMIFDEEFAEEMKFSFWSDVQDSYQINRKDWANRGKGTIFFQQLMALLGPVL